MTGTELRMEEIRRRTKIKRRRNDRRAISRLSMLSLFLFVCMNAMLRCVQGFGVVAVAGAYGTVLLRQGAGAYIVVAIAGFVIGVTLTALLLRLRDRGTARRF